MVSSGWPCFFLPSSKVFFGGTFLFLTPHTRPSLTNPTAFRLPTYANWPPPSPTYLLSTQLPTYLPPNYLPMYLHTESPPRQQQHSLTRVLQYIM
jgi:hypothetical protein